MKTITDLQNSKFLATLQKLRNFQPKDCCNDSIEDKKNGPLNLLNISHTCTHK